MEAPDASDRIDIDLLNFFWETSSSELLSSSVDSGILALLSARKENIQLKNIQCKIVFGTYFGI